MLTKSGWLIDNKVTLIQYHGVLKIEDVSGAIRDILPLIDRGTAPVHTIIDMQHVEKMNFAIHEMNSLPEGIAYYQNPNVGWTVYYGHRENPFYQMVAAVVAQNYEARMRWFTDQAAALKFLQEVDDQLPVLTPELVAW